MNKTDLKLIKAASSDKAYLLSLRKLTMTEHLERVGRFYTDKQHLARIEMHYEFAKIIFYKNEKIGTIKFLIHDEELEILQIQIHPEYQGKGFGNIVINYIINQANNKPVKLSVLKGNPAKKLYESLGFIVINENEQEWFMQT